MAKHLLILSIVMGTLVTTACMVRARPVHAGVMITTPVPPPAIRVEAVPPSPGGGWVWVGGYWAWTGASWTWVTGEWVTAAPGYVWVAPRYVRRGGSWVWVRGHFWHPQQRHRIYRHRPGRQPPPAARHQRPRRPPPPARRR